VTGTEIGYAKINLALHVRRRRADGYHEIETIFAFAEHGDVLSADARRGGSEHRLSITGPFGSGLSAGRDNLVIRAAGAAAARFPASVPSAVDFILDKRLPIAAGIGGGSADAAAALRLLCPDVDRGELLDLATGLGADVAACLVSRTCRGEGVGERLAALEEGGLVGMPLLLVNPGVPCETGPVFAAWDGTDRGALAMGDPLRAALGGRNDLEAPARRLVPVIGEVIDELSGQAGVVLARMSGSGATCFALFENERRRDKAAAVIAAARPGWWCLATRLR
jgi:4-diphosphocytidyl-2-C-methyl-D-erythritol kinase